ncbi:MAG TPA: ATP-binding protein [Caldisericia bacterium]|nr:ATP-binding protein [Caldisericia bacterium]
MDLSKWNSWWRDGSVKKELLGKRRNSFYEIIKFADKRQIIAIKGQRRVGKTTLMYQIIDYLLKEMKIDKFKILYFSFDEEIEEIDRLLDFYQKDVLKNKIDKFDKIYLFFDEIQKLKDFSKKIKILYDLNPNLKIFISGSSSLEIDKGYKENLTGRCIEFILKPLTFKEYLDFKNIDVDKERVNVYIKDLEIELLKYILNSGIIEVINEDDEEFIRKYFIDSILNRIIYQDITQSFRISEPEMLIKIFKIISSRPGSILNYQNLSMELGRDRRTIEKYIDYLKYSMLINIVFNFSKNLSTSEKKLKKVYNINTTYSYLFSKEMSNLNETLPFIYETIIVNNFDINFFFRTTSKREVDFIKIDNNKIIPIELKYKERIRNDDLNGLIYFLDKFKLDEGILLTKDLKKEEMINNKKITFIPLVEFLLNY